MGDLTLPQPNKDNQSGAAMTYYEEASATIKCQFENGSPR